ncbi:MAG: DNA mismatch repair protein MutS [Phycisphaerae bacterium]
MNEPQSELTTKLEPPASAITPAMKQYVEQKAQVGDAILFFRMGDFYEMFYEDAKTASRVLGLALTSRNKGENPVPLAGVPFHAVESYLARMVKAGYKVAISEQVEDPKLAKGVVKRKIVRIVTPGTLTENIMLQDREVNYLASCDFNGEAGGVAWVELSTGEFRTVVVPAEQVIDELVRLRPAELLLPEVDTGSDAVRSARFRKLARQFQEILEAAVTYRPAWWFDQNQAQNALTEQFGTIGLEGFGFDQFDISLASAGAILEYLAETQLTALEHIRRIQRLSRGKYLQLDQTTVRSLELERTMRTGSRDGTLLGVMDQTCTAMGARRLRQWLMYPLRDYDDIIMRQDAVDLLLQRQDVLRQIRLELKNFADMERISARIGTGRASPRDIASLGESFRRFPKLIEFLEPVKVAGSFLETIAAQLSGLDELGEYIGRAIVDQPPAHLRDGGVIADNFDTELDRLRSISRDGQTWLIQFQARQIERTGISTLKVGYNSVFGYYIEITHANKDRAPADYVRKQTIKNAERYINEELKKYEQEQLTADDRAKELESQIFEKVRRQAAEKIERIQLAGAAISKLDVLISFAYLAAMRGYSRPQIVTEPVLQITQGRHPVLDVSLAEKFVPNDTDLNPKKTTMMIITGPNMAGKSTYIRQVALLVLLAHTGSFIPAKEATIGLTDRIFTRVGASDELSRGQSTFMVEMTEAANILNNATANSLVILDEIGRGTSTYDGLALAWAIAEHIAKHLFTRTLFATHYHELTELEELIPGVKNFNILIREWHDQIIFLHKIAPGGTDKSYGIHVARLAGLPKETISRARTILAELERNFAREAKQPELGGNAPADINLFDQPQSAVIDELKDLQTDHITPLQAIQILNDLQSRLKGQ